MKARVSLLILFIICGSNISLAKDKEPDRLTESYLVSIIQNQEEREQLLSNPDYREMVVTLDVNGDNKFDNADRALVQSYIQSGYYSTLACPAALDLDTNGVLNDQDVPHILTWLEHQSPVPNQLITRRDELECDHSLAPVRIVSATTLKPNKTAYIYVAATKLQTTPFSIGIDYSASTLINGLTRVIPQLHPQRLGLQYVLAGGPSASAQVDFQIDQQFYRLIAKPSMGMTPPTNSTPAIGVPSITTTTNDAICTNQKCALWINSFFSKLSQDGSDWISQAIANYSQRGCRIFYFQSTLLPEPQPVIFPDTVIFPSPAALHEYSLRLAKNFNDFSKVKKSALEALKEGGWRNFNFMMFAHGSPGACGAWVADVTSAFEIQRAVVLDSFLPALKENSCGSYNVDMSCFGGRFVNGAFQHHNTGSNGSCNPSFPHNRIHHKVADRLSAISTATDSIFSTDFQVEGAAAELVSDVALNGGGATLSLDAASVINFNNRLNEQTIDMLRELGQAITMNFVSAPLLPNVAPTVMTDGGECSEEPDLIAKIACYKKYNKP